MENFLLLLELEQVLKSITLILFSILSVQPYSDLFSLHEENNIPRMFVCVCFSVCICRVSDTTYIISKGKGR